MLLRHLRPFAFFALKSSYFRRGRQLGRASVLEALMLAPMGLDPAISMGWLLINPNIH